MSDFSTMGKKPTEQEGAAAELIAKRGEIDYYFAKKKRKKKTGTGLSRMGQWPFKDGESLHFGTILSPPPPSLSLLSTVGVAI